VSKLNGVKQRVFNFLSYSLLISEGAKQASSRAEVDLVATVNGVNSVFSPFHLLK
jgi:hypothetical protein